MAYWLLKSEPETFGIEHLANSKNKTTGWDGVRNYQARNFLQKQMRKGDLAFFYHSSCAIPGIVGIVEVIREGYPDESAMDPLSDYYDAKSTPQNPRWYKVDVKLVKQFDKIITLSILRQQPALKNMQLLKQGNRLSVLPVSSEEWQAILKLAASKIE
jgi:predicted RNA-binding protein with PUA-like domain